MPITAKEAQLRPEQQPGDATACRIEERDGKKKPEDDRKTLPVI